MKWVVLAKDEWFRHISKDPKRFLEVVKYPDGSIIGRITPDSHVGEYSSVATAKACVKREALIRGLLALALPFVVALSIFIGSASAQTQGVDAGKALNVAVERWGVDLGDKVEFHYSKYMVGCKLNRRDNYAITTVRWSQSVLKDDDGKIIAGSEQPIVYTYSIELNPSCDWNQRLLEQVMTHEYGHILIGAQYHSGNKHSIMYPYIPFGDYSQRVTDSDRAQLHVRKGE
jgi:hypothetical protein